MSSRNTPNNQRPLPPEVYQRRRIAAVIGLLVVLVILVLVLRACASGSDGGDVQSAAETSSTTPDMKGPASPPNESTSADKTTDGSSSEKTDAQGSEKDSTKSQASEKSGDAAAQASSQKKDCTLEDLQVTAVPGAPSFGGNTKPNFFAKIKNPTKGDCKIDANKNPLMFEVFGLHDYQRVWGDLDCNKPEVTNDITVEAGKTVSFEMDGWSRTTSAPQACDDRKPVPAGSYLLYAHLGNNVSEPATFNLS